MFFGRSVEVTELAELVRSPAERANPAVLLVVGPSGCGKSSLVRAGLVPAMANEQGWWTLPPMLPGADPIAALGAEIAEAARMIGLDWTIAEVRRGLESNCLAELAAELLLAAPGPRRRRLLLVVDQFEELLTQTPPPDRQRFGKLLGQGLSGPLQMVATLRPEFLDQLMGCTELAGLATHPYMLHPLLRDALPSVIEQPATVAGLDVDEGLVNRLVSDTDGGGALPLLAYTLSQLANGLTRGDRLRMSRYEELGGVHGTLTRQAEGALAEAMTATGRTREQVIRSLLGLVTIDERGRPTRWRVPRAELPATAISDIEPFVTRRLLTSGSDDDGAVVEVVHEAFLSAWAPLARAVEENSAALRARRKIEQAAEEWSEARRPSNRLWERGQLASALTDTGARIHPIEKHRRSVTDASGTGKRRPARRGRVVIADRVALSCRAREFLHTSIKRDRRRRRRSTTVLVLLLILSLVVAAGAAIQLRQGEQQRRAATAQLLMDRAETTLNTDPRTALQLGEAAYQLDSDAHRAGLERLVRGTQYAGSLNRGTRVLSLAIAPDNRTLAITGLDGTVTLWDVADPGRPRGLGEPLPRTGDPQMTSVTFSPDGRIMASASLNDPVTLWDVTDPAHPQPLGPLTTNPSPSNTSCTGNGCSPLDSGAESVAFAPDGRTLAAAGNYGVVLWNVANPASPQLLGEPLTGHIQGAAAVAFSPDGRTLASGGGDGVMLWNVTNPAHVERLAKPNMGPGSYVSSLAFSPDGHTLASNGAGRWMLLWDVTDPARPQHREEPLASERDVKSVAFAPKGEAVAAGDWDGTVTLWDLREPARTERLGIPLTGHTTIVQALAFSPNGRILASADWDGKVMLWNVADPPRAQGLGPPLTGHVGAVTAAAFAPDGRILASGGDDGNVILWDATDRSRPKRLGQPLSGHSKNVNAVAFAPDGRTLASAGWDGSVLLWDVSVPTRPRRLGDPLPHMSTASAVVFAPNGRLLATADQTGAILWDVSDPAQPQPHGEYLDGEGNVDSVTFTPDGRILALSTGTVTLWDVSDPARLQRLGEPLTEEHEFGDGETIATPVAVSSLTFAPDRPTLAAGDDGTVTLWDMTDPVRPQRVGAPLTGHTGRVSAVAFAPDGRTLASAGEDGTVLISDVSTPTGPQRLGELLTEHAQRASLSEWDRHGVSSVAFASDGHTLASAGYDGQMILWEVSASTGAHRHGEPFTGHSGNVTSAAFTPDSRLLATAGVDGAMIVWDMSDPAQPRRLGEPLTAAGGVYSVAFSHDGHILISDGRERVTTWDMTDPAQPHPLPRPGGKPLQAAMLSAASYPEAQLVVGADQDGKLAVWDVADPNNRRGEIPMADNERATSATLAPNRPILAAATALTVEENLVWEGGSHHSTSLASGTVTLWDVSDPAHPKRYEHPLSGTTDTVLSVIFARDGNTAASLSEDGLVILWDVRDPAQPKRIGQLRSATTDRITSAEFAPDGRTIATASQDGIVILWDLTDPARPNRIAEPLPGHTNAVHLSFAPDGRTLATASNTGMYLWDLTDLNSIRGTALQHACSSTGGIDQTEWARLVPLLSFEDPC